MAMGKLPDRGQFDTCPQRAGINHLTEPSNNLGNQRNAGLGIKCKHGYGGTPLGKGLYVQGLQAAQCAALIGQLYMVTPGNAA